MTDRRLDIPYPPGVRRLLLWDIDGTLLRSSGVGSEAFRRAVASVVGYQPEFTPMMAGKTDPQIASEWLTALHEDSGPDAVAAVMWGLEVELEKALPTLRERGRALEGVGDLLGSLQRDDSVVQSVCTGNILPNARMKLSCFDLARWLDLDIGAYGSDNPDRRCLVPVALDRASLLRGLKARAEDTWVIGDTPLDLQCARAANARCMLVATGGSTLEELRSTDADLIVEDLRDTAKLHQLLTA